MKIHIQSYGLKEVLRGLQAMERKLNVEKTEVLDVVATFLETAMKRRIHELKKAPDDSAWKPWSKAYARLKERKFPNHRMLENEGTLRDSIEGRVDGNKAKATTNLIYAEYQNDMRPFVGLSDAEMTELKELIATQLFEAYEEAAS